MSELRPIGTEFWSEPQWSSPNESGKYQMKFFYRVVAHDACANSLAPNAPTYMAERVEALRVQTRKPLVFQTQGPCECCGQLPNSIPGMPGFVVDGWTEWEERK